MQLVETGFDSKLIRNAAAEIQFPSYWSMPTTNEMEPLILKHVMLSFLIFSAGLGLGLVAFISELGHYKSKFAWSK